MPPMRQFKFSNQPSVCAQYNKPMLAINMPKNGAKSRNHTKLSPTCSLADSMDKPISIDGTKYSNNMPTMMETLMRTFFIAAFKCGRKKIQTAFVGSQTQLRIPTRLAILKPKPVYRPLMAS